MRGSRAADDGAASALRAGGVVIAFRHALAPGTFDPPGFTIGECHTQRNLNDEGRAQARRIGEWFKARSLSPARVRTSPWCRCTATADLAFGRHEVWPALGSPARSTEATNRAHQRELLDELAAVAATPGRFDVWVTHQFVLSSLLGSALSSGEGMVIRSTGTDKAPTALASWRGG